MTSTEEGMLHYPALLCGTGDPGYAIFGARSTREEALQALRDKDTQTLRRRHDEGMRARGDYDTEAAEVVLTSADLFEELAAEQQDRLGDAESCRAE